MSGSETLVEALLRADLARALSDAVRAAHKQHLPLPHAGSPSGRPRRTLRSPGTLRERRRQGNGPNKPGGRAGGAVSTGTTCPVLNPPVCSHGLRRPAPVGSIDAMLSIR